MTRYYLGVDWADTEHAVWVGNEAGEEVMARSVEHTPAGLGEFGRWLYERQAEGIELWAAIEKPEGRGGGFLLGHGGGGGRGSGGGGCMSTRRRGSSCGQRSRSRRGAWWISCWTMA